MKYLLALLIVLGGFITLIGIIVLIIYVCDKAREWEWEFEWKHSRYHKIKERLNNYIIPWLVGIFMFSLFIGCLIGLYFEVLKLL